MFNRLPSLFIASLAVGSAVANPIAQWLLSDAARSVCQAVSQEALLADGDHHGSATWFTQDGVAGACGQKHLDSEHVVALQTTEYSNGAHCGKTISITDPSTGKTATGLIADECPGCGATNNIDLSTSLFKVFAPQSTGRINVVWRFV